MSHSSQNSPQGRDIQRSGAAKQTWSLSSPRLTKNPVLLFAHQRVTKVLGMGKDLGIMQISVPLCSLWVGAGFPMRVLCKSSSRPQKCKIHGGPVTEFVHSTSQASAWLADHTLGPPALPGWKNPEMFIVRVPLDSFCVCGQSLFPSCYHSRTRFFEKGPRACRQPSTAAGIYSRAPPILLPAPQQSIARNIKDTGPSCPEARGHFCPQQESAGGHVC